MRTGHRVRRLAPMTQQPPDTGVDLASWEALGAAYWTTRHGAAPPSGASARTEAARRRAPVRRAVPTVDLYVDPVCPYTWLVARWLHQVERQRDLELRYHVMSLRMLNEGRTMHPTYRRVVENSAGPSRVATAVATQHGPQSLRAWHTAFCKRIFDRWHLPSIAEYDDATQAALATVGLPTTLADAARTDDYDNRLRRSHDEGTMPVGIDCGTPVIHLEGAAFFGPVLQSVPHGAAALRLFDSVRALSAEPEFYELKRTRTAPPDLSSATASRDDAEARP